MAEGGGVAQGASLHWTELIARSGIDESVVRSNARRRKFARNEVIFHEGDPAGAFHLIDKGCVAVRLTTPRGDVATVDVLHAGDTFGEQSIVDGTAVRSATVIAVDKVETLSLSLATFDELRVSHPQLDRFLLMVVSMRLRSTSHRLLEALYVPAESRVLRCLLRMSEIFAFGSTMHIPMTQEQIASITGVTRSTANRLLRSAETDGLINVTRSRIEVLDEPALRRRAGLRVGEPA